MTPPIELPSTRDLTDETGEAIPHELLVWDVRLLVRFRRVEASSGGMRVVARIESSRALTSNEQDEASWLIRRRFLGVTNFEFVQPEVARVTTLVEPVLATVIHGPEASRSRSDSFDIEVTAHVIVDSPPMFRLLIDAHAVAAIRALVPEGAPFLVRYRNELFEHCTFRPVDGIVDVSHAPLSFRPLKP